MFVKLKKLPGLTGMDSVPATSYAPSRLGEMAGTVFSAPTGSSPPHRNINLPDLSSPHQKILDGDSNGGMAALPALKTGTSPLKVNRLPGQSRANIFDKEPRGRSYGAPLGHNHAASNALDLISQIKEERERKVRESSEKIKKNMNKEEGGSQATAANTLGTSSGDASLNAQTRFRVRAPEGGDKRVNRSLDTDVRHRSRAAGINLPQIGEGNHHLKVNPGPAEIKDKVLRPRTEEYTETIHDNLEAEIKTHLVMEIQRFVFAKQNDQERVHNFSKIMINGLYASKFLNRKTMVFTPAKVYLPKQEVNLC